MKKQSSMSVALLLAVTVAFAPGFGVAASKPNILLIVSDDTGWGDLGPYGGGEGRGMPTPNIDRMAADGMTFFSFLRPAELHTGSGRHTDRPDSEPQRHDHRGVSGPGRRTAGGGVVWGRC